MTDYIVKPKNMSTSTMLARFPNLACVQALLGFTIMSLSNEQLCGM